MNYLALKSILCNSKRSYHVVIAVALSVSIIYSSFVVADGFVRRVEGMTEGYVVTDLLFVIDPTVSLGDASIPAGIVDQFSDEYSMGVIRCNAASKEHGLVIWGVDFVEYKEVRRPRITGDLPSENWEVLVGSRLASLYGIDPGSIVEVNVGGVYYELLVTGVASGGQYDLGFISNLQTARMLRPEMVDMYSLVEIKSSDSANVLETLDLDGYGLEVVQSLGMQDYMLGIAAEVRGDLYLVSVVVAFLSLVSVSHTMYKILGDSMRDLFILRSIGLTRWGVIQTIVVDSVTLSLAGAFIGLLVGNLLSNAASLFSFLVLKTAFLPVRYDATLFANCLLLSLLVGVLGGLVPVLLKKPVEEAYGVLKAV